MADCLGLDKLSMKNKKILDPSFGGRYLGLSQFLKVWLPKLEKDHFFEIFRHQLGSKFFEVLWVSASDLEFESCLKKLEVLLKNLVQADWRERFDVENKISDLLKRTF